MKDIKIGKFVKLKDNKYFYAPYDFFLILAYDEIDQKYVGKMIGETAFTIPYIGIKENEIERVFTIYSIIQFHEDMIEKNQRIINIINQCEEAIKDKGNNIKTEYMTILRTYMSTYRQIDKLKNRMNLPESENSERNQYILNTLTKGLGRLEKRLHFFFGQDKKEIIDYLISNPITMDAPCELKMYCQKEINKLRVQVDQLKKIKP